MFYLETNPYSLVVPLMYCMNWICTAWALFFVFNSAYLIWITGFATWKNAEDKKAFSTEVNRNIKNIVG